MNWVGSINNTLVPKHPSSVPVWLHSSVGRLGQLSATGDLTYSIPEPHILLMLDRLPLVLSLIKAAAKLLCQYELPARVEAIHWFGLCVCSPQFWEWRTWTRSAALGAN